MLILLSCAVGLLPYSFKRPDPPHFMPLTAVLLTSILVGAALWNSIQTRLTLAIALCITLLPMTWAVLIQSLMQGLPVKPGRLTTEISRVTQECSGLIPKDARSLFVGKGSYQEYQINWPILYLANPQLRPATAFISEEPGVQNTCYFGTRISNDLAHAPRPTAVILDGVPWHDDTSEVFKLPDCGKIEAELTTLRVSPVGFCSVRWRRYEVAVIR